MQTANCVIAGRRKSDGTYDLSSSAYVGYGSATEFFPYSLKFTLPNFVGKSSAVKFSLAMIRGFRNGTQSPKVNLRWALCTSDANLSKYNTSGTVSDSNQIVSGVVTYDGLSSSVSYKELTVSTGALESGKSYYLIFWGNNSGGYSGDTATMYAASNHSATLTYLNTYKLSISQGTGSTIAVIHNGSTLTNGATVTEGDVLTISFGAVTGYNLGTHTVNGVTFTSGGTHTVAADVTVVATASKKTFVLTISQGTGSIITVKRSGAPLSNGATITYGDVLTISFGAEIGYDLGSHTVNGAAFDSGGTHTVTAAVAVVSTAAKKTFILTISQGTGSVVTVLRSGAALSDGATITYGDELTINFGAEDGYSLVDHTVNGAAFDSGGTHMVTAAVAVVTTAARKTFRLTISQGTGAVITVMRSGVALSGGATIVFGDELVITFGAEDGYCLSSHTVNGVSFASGGTHTVAEDVVVVAEAYMNAFKLTITASRGSKVKVTRDGIQLASGEDIAQGDELVITFAAKAGYQLTASTINGEAATQESIVVAGDVDIVAAARVVGILFISNRPYRMCVKLGGKWYLLIWYIGRVGTWAVTGQVKGG